MIKQKKTKKKNVNVSQTVVVNIQKGKRNPRAKASAPQVMSAPQIIQPQVGSAYHQAVYGGRAPAVPMMGNVPGYYAGMMSPFNQPLHIASEVQQAQLRQMNELAAANVARPSLKSSGSAEPFTVGVAQQSVNAPIYNLDKQEAKPMTVPLSLTPSKPFQPSLSMEAPEVAASAASSSSSSMLSPEEVAPPVEMNDRVLGYKISQQSLNELPYKRKDRNDTRVFLTDIASARGIPLPRTVVGKKADVINYLIQQINK
jgi:hypothetical protein